MECMRDVTCIYEDLTDCGMYPNTLQSVCAVVEVHVVQLVIERMGRSHFPTLIFGRIRENNVTAVKELSIPST